MDKGVGLGVEINPLVTISEMSRHNETNSSQVAPLLYYRSSFRILSRCKRNKVFK